MVKMEVDMKFCCVVTAYRFGSNERHSYLLGVYSKKHAAIIASENKQKRSKNET